MTGTKKLPIVLAKKIEQATAAPSIVVVPKGCFRQRTYALHAAQTVPAGVGKHLPVAGKVLVATVAREHNLAMLTSGPAHGKGRKHGDIRKRLVVVIDEIVKERQQFLRRKMNFMMIGVEVRGNLPGERSFIQLLVVE